MERIPNFDGALGKLLLRNLRMRWEGNIKFDLGNFLCPVADLIIRGAEPEGSCTIYSSIVMHFQLVHLNMSES
jgi:hypothetical protein